MEEDPDAVVAIKMAHPTRATRGLMLAEISDCSQYAFGPLNARGVKAARGDSMQYYNCT